MLYFITHPEVIIDPNNEITQWDLSDKGVKEFKQILTLPWVKSIDVIYSSEEVKAKQAADILASSLNLQTSLIKNLGENDRSSTGYLPKHDFEQMADRFFANPNTSIKGWEAAKDAQSRIVSAIKEIIENHKNKNIAVVSHGGVGALLLAHLLQKPISRSFDQPSQGHYFLIDTVDLSTKSTWIKI